MISSLAKEVAYWIDANAGKRPSAVRVPQAIMDLCDDEMKRFGIRDTKSGVPKESFILGIPFLVDPTLTIGKIDP